MWPSKCIHIFMCVCFIRFVEALDMCGQSYEIPKWEPRESMPPGNVKLDLVQEPLDSVDTPGFTSLTDHKMSADIGLIQAQLKARVENIRDNFTLTLFTNPFINDGNCPPANSSYLNLREFHESYGVTRVLYEGDKESESISIGEVSTGCYYAQMKNAQGKKWLQDPVFYNTSYEFYDTMLKCINVRFQPANYQKSMQLKYDIEIPLTCFRVECKLFEINEETNNIERHLDENEILATQSCDLTHNGIGMAPLVECNRDDKRAKLSATIATNTEKGDGWKTIITWDNLVDGGATYYTLFTQYSNGCNRSGDDLKKWLPVFMFGASRHGFRNATNAVYGTPKIDFPHTQSFWIILYTLLAVVLTAILIYWVSKYARILLQTRDMANDLLVKLPEISQLHDEKEAHHILLIYTEDSPPIMTAVNVLRSHLQQICSVPVHALYSNDELNTIMTLGATGWVEHFLKDGSKVIWVDTPQFRSVLKDYKSHKGQEKQYIAGDFRDQAIPYALALATSLFQNSTTQYRCHFVVRLERFQVDEGSDDPLQVVSPHVRYYIPEHLSLLCEHVSR